MASPTAFEQSPEHEEYDQGVSYEEESDEENDEWLVKEILAENTRKRMYKIAWDGIDPETGKPWDATWEPYSAVTQELIEEWETMKAADAEKQRNLKKRSRTMLMNEQITRQARPGDSPDNSDAEHRSETPRSSSRSPTLPIIINDSDLDASANYNPSRSERTSEERKRTIKRSANGRKATRPRGRFKRGDAAKPDEADDEAPGQEQNSMGDKSVARRRRRTSPRPNSTPSQPKSRKRLRREKSDTPVAVSSSSRNKKRRNTPPAYTLPGSDGEDVNAKSRRNGDSSGITEANDSFRSPDSLSDGIVVVSSSSRLKAKKLRETEDLYDDDGAHATSDLEDDGSYELPPPLASRQNGNKTDIIDESLKKTDQRDRSRSIEADSKLPRFRRIQRSENVLHEAPVGHLFDASGGRRLDSQGWPIELEANDASHDGMNDDIHDNMDGYAEPPFLEAEALVVPDSQPSATFEGSGANSVNVIKDSQLIHEESPNLPLGMDARGRSVRRPSAIAPIKVPDPKVFKPFLPPDDHSQLDDIQQFSSQPHADLDLHRLPPSHRALRQSTPVVIVPKRTSQQYKRSRSSLPPSGDVAETGEGQKEPTQPVSATADTLTSSETSRASQGILAPLPSSAVSLSDSAVAAIAEPATVSAISPTSPQEIPEPELKEAYDVQEVSTSIQEATKQVKASPLLDEGLRSELALFLEIPEYYGQTGRMLTEKSSWEIELTKMPVGGSWFILIKPGTAQWSLERRVVKPTKTVFGHSIDELRNETHSSSESATHYSRLLTMFDQLMHSHNNLQATYDMLKISNDQAIARIATLESDLEYSRSQYLEAAARGEVYNAQNKTLQKEVAKLKGNLTVGLEQARLFGEAKEERLQSEIQRMKKEIDFMKEMARRTADEDIRSKAARVTELEGREADRVKNTVYWPAINDLAASMAEAQASATGGPGITLMEDDSSEDEDFVAGSSDEDGDSYTSSDEEAPQPLTQPQTEIVQPIPEVATYSRRPSLSEVMFVPPPPYLTSEQVYPPTEGLPSPVVPSTVSLNGDAIPAVSHDSHETSGETSNPLSTNPSAKPSTVESENILELDSMACDSQEAYFCQWDKAHGKECKQGLESQKALYEHLLTHVQNKESIGNQD